jgi:hypothetical protein
MALDINPNYIMNPHSKSWELQNPVSKTSTMPDIAQRFNHAHHLT